jgi:hypothetical protein
MYFQADGLMQRSNSDGDNGWSRPQAISIIYYIAVIGEFIATDVFFPLAILTAAEIAAACQRLNEIATGVVSILRFFKKVDIRNSLQTGYLTGNTLN